MKKTISLFLLAMVISISSFALNPLTGTMSACIGSSSYISEDSTYPGGTWSSSNTAIATVTASGPSSAYVTGVSAGTCTITYSLMLSYVTATFSVSGTLPAPITGTTSFCMGTSSTLTDATPGGTWSSSNPSIATIGATTGIATGISAGTATIYYATGSGCSQSTLVTITSTAPLPDSILGTSTVCIGSTITLTDATPGGTWSSGSPAVASINPSGVVTSISAGSAMIYYTITTGCGTSVTSTLIPVVSSVSPGTISGSTTVAVGSTSTLYDYISGGTWSSSNTAVATIGATTGIVTGVTAGAATITYTVSGCGSTAYTTAAITVATINRISGHVNFVPASPLDSFGTLKIWLINYNTGTHMLEAIDSFSATSIMTSVYYEFLSEPTDSYRVKAAYFPTTFSGTGFIPTYHTSSFYWSAADVIYHTTAMANDGTDINMAYGTVTSGPGFIAGDVSTGANKGTSGTLPAINMLVYAINSSGTLIQQTYTDATGHYSFSNLPLGTYSVRPELINYYTTPYSGINLTSGSSSFTDASFGQHTISKSILPKTTGLNNLSPSLSTVSLYPNPTSGKLNIIWNESAAETVNITITNITGRIVYNTSMKVAQGFGENQVDLSGLVNGTYLVSVKSGTINCNYKIQVQK